MPTATSTPYPTGHTGGDISILTKSSYLSSSVNFQNFSYVVSINDLPSDCKTSHLVQLCDVVFRGNAGSDCVSESTSNDGVIAPGDDSASGVIDKRQQTSSDVTDDAVRLARRQIPPAARSAAAASTGRQHEYHHQVQINGYDAHCYASNEAVSAAATAGYLSGIPLSCMPPYFASNTRTSVFHSNHALESTGDPYSMQRA